MILSIINVLIYISCMVLEPLVYRIWKSKFVRLNSFFFVWLDTRTYILLSFLWTISIKPSRYVFSSWHRTGFYLVCNTSDSVPWWNSCLLHRIIDSFPRILKWKKIKIKKIWLATREPNTKLVLIIYVLLFVESCL